MGRLRRLQHEEEVSLVEHLDELRTRIIVALVALGVAFAVAFWQHQQILDLLNRDLPNNALGHRIQPTTLGVGEPFMVSVTISLWTGVVLASPIVFYQLYAFIVPAFESGPSLRRHWPLLLLVPFLFLAGVGFGYAIVLPKATAFLLGFDSSHYNTLVKARDYYSFCTTILLVMGLIFEMPAAIMGLARLGIVSSALLLQQWRVAIVGLTVLAAALPGVDPVTTILEAIPLVALYFVSIFLAKLVENRAAEPEAGPPAVLR